MKKLLFASAALAAFIGTSAFAADMAAPVYKAPPPAAPVWSWTGFYLGANVGGAWANHSTFTMSDPLGSFPFDPFSFSTSSPASAIGGVHGGYNYQAGPSWLVGLEADFSWTGLKLTGNSPMTAIGGIVIPNANAFDNTKVKDIGTVRARTRRIGHPRLALLCDRRLCLCRYWISGRMDLWPARMRRRSISLYGKLQ